MFLNALWSAYQVQSEHHFAEMEHQSRMAPPAKRPKIWKDFHDIWAKEEFNFSVWAKFEPRMGHMEGIVATSKCKSEEGEILT